MRPWRGCSNAVATLLHAFCPQPHLPRAKKKSVACIRGWRGEVKTLLTDRPLSCPLLSASAVCPGRSEEDHCRRWSGDRCTGRTEPGRGTAHLTRTRRARQGRLPNHGQGTMLLAGVGVFSVCREPPSRPRVRFFVTGRTKFCRVSSAKFEKPGSPTLETLKNLVPQLQNRAATTYGRLSQVRAVGLSSSSSHARTRTHR